MATLALHPQHSNIGDERFFLRGAIAMTLLIFAAFSTQLAMGRSTFSSPLLVHAHAVVFMGWVVLYLLQNIFVATNNMALHRRLGWIATGWMAAMLVLGCWVTVAMIRRGQVPFFFRPVQFLIFDPLSLVAFVGLTSAAIFMRRRTEWHRRLHFCGMSMLLAPAFGRLLPMPFLPPFAWEASFTPGLLFPLAGAIADYRRGGRVHPAWRWGIGTMLGALLVIELLTFSPIGGAIYGAATRGSPGAAVDGMAFPPPPIGPLVTGRTAGH
ncbi:MAG: hypothetical protein ABIO85_06955 [Sphingomicrobium sp.]